MSYVTADAGSKIINTASGTVASAVDIEGGYFSVNSLTDIPNHAKVTGALCYCISDSSFYQYNGTAWNKANLGGGLSGGTLSGPLTVTGGDSATAGKIILSQSGTGQITDSGTSTLFGFLNSNDLTLGHNSYNLKMRGKEISTDRQISAESFNATSDARLKENFTEYTSDKSILDLPIYTFDFINGAKNQLGCKAQDLQKICPEIVIENEDGYLSIQESKLVYLLLGEIRKLNMRLDQLERSSK
jgi:hypothetical protein